MSRWMLAVHGVDFSPLDLSKRIDTYDAFCRFGDEAFGWLETFPLSAAYQLGRAARLMMRGADPLLMNDADVGFHRDRCIRPLMQACPPGTATKDVFERVWEAGLLPHGAGLPVAYPPRYDPMEDAQG